MKLFYVRHGKTQGNLDKTYVGHTESPLLGEGIEAIKKVGQQISAAGQHIDVIFTSHLKRQLDSAKLIAQEISYPFKDIMINDLLRERYGGSFEGKTQAEFFALTEEQQVAAGAESLKELSERATVLLELVRKNYSDKTVLFVGSATIGEMLRAMVKYNDYTKVFDDGPMPNAELIQLI